jgi:15-cis-phytoene synthase
MKELFDTSCYKTSKLITKSYSTSFSLGILFLSPHIRNYIYSIYGFVRFADEIVDTFHNYPQQKLLDRFIQDYQIALEEKISLNPILNSFQEVVHKFQLTPLVESFLKSMKMDLVQTNYTTEEEYKEYIYGSADVVGLMCLRVFVNGDEEKYNQLKPFAEKLGSAFQKVNFLRDYSYDSMNLGRSYFPNIDMENLNSKNKAEIIENINKDFDDALIGINRLPMNSKLGVYVAYKYYKKLLIKLKKHNAEAIIENRIRIPNHYKAYLFLKAYVRYKVNVL